MSDFFSDNKDDIRSQLTSNIGSYIHIFIYSKRFSENMRRLPVLQRVVIAALCGGIIVQG